MDEDPFLKKAMRLAAGDGRPAKPVHSYPPLTLEELRELETNLQESPGGTMVLRAVRELIAIREFDVEKYIQSLTWIDASDHEQSLVNGNLRTMAHRMLKTRLRG